MSCLLHDIFLKCLFSDLRHLSGSRHGSIEFSIIKTLLSNMFTLSVWRVQNFNFMSPSRHLFQIVLIFDHRCNSLADPMLNFKIEVWVTRSEIESGR